MKKKIEVVNASTLSTRSTIGERELNIKKTCVEGKLVYEAEK
jgi:hypothetical protein